MAKQLTVVYNEYATNGDEGACGVVKTYTGKDEVACLRKIMKAHSYEFEGMEKMSAKVLYRNIMCANGDGCDYIVDIYEGKPVPYRPKRG